MGGFLGAATVEERSFDLAWVRFGDGWSSVVSESSSSISFSSSSSSSAAEGDPRSESSMSTSPSVSDGGGWERVEMLTDVERAMTAT